MKKLIILFIAVVGFGVSSFAQETATATASIISAIGLAKTGDISFGSIIPGSGGTVTVAAVVTPTAEKSAGITLITGTATSSLMTVTGGENTHYKISIPVTTVLLLGADAKTMSAEISCSRTLNSSIDIATNTFYIGGVLTVGDITSNPAGVYTSAAFAVNVAYE